MLIEDKRGNKIYDKESTVFLFLKQKGETRRLCTLKDGNIFVKKKNRHIFRSLHAYWFNYELLKSLDIAWFINVWQEDWSHLKTTIWNVIKNGKILNFWSEWFEKQIFLPIDKFVI